MIQVLLTNKKEEENSFGRKEEEGEWEFSFYTVCLITAGIRYASPVGSWIVVEGQEGCWIDTTHKYAC